MITVLAFLLLMMAIVIPQLATSIYKLARNLNTYVATIQGWLEDVGLGSKVLGRIIDLQKLADTSGMLLETLIKYLSENTGKIISISTVAGITIFNFVIAFILSHVRVIYRMPLLQKRCPLNPGILSSGIGTPFCKHASGCILRCHMCAPAE